MLLTDMAELLGLPGMRSRERTLEAPYALRALAALPTGSPRKKTESMRPRRCGGKESAISVGAMVA